MTVTLTPMPLPTLDRLSAGNAANDAFYFAACLPSAASLSNARVRMLKHNEEMDGTRFVLSGKLSDVCAALDQLAALEQHNAWRCASI